MLIPPVKAILVIATFSRFVLSGINAKHMGPRRLPGYLAFACAATLAGCHTAPNQSPGAELSFAQRCQALPATGAPGLQRAEFQANQTVQYRFAPQEVLPPHCEAFGTLEPRTGIDGQEYAIGYHLRLPEHWNGKFFFEGGGGTNGNIGTATGTTGATNPSALAQGYAVVSQDSGHSNDLNNNPQASGTASFGHDPIARRNYGHASLKKVSDAAVAAITRFYGQSPRYSYFMGCSKGGQEGMAFAQKYPEVFDGIVASAPGMSLPRAALSQLWDVQQFAQLAMAPGDTSLDPAKLAKVFSAEQITTLQTTVIKTCDGLDGLEDGIIGNFSACTNARVIPQLRQQVCSDAARCLTSQQVSVLEQSLTGPVNKQGEPIYAAWPWDTGVGSPGWQMWKLGNEQMPALNVMLGGTATPAIFSVPPVAVAATPQAAAAYALAFDVADGEAIINATSDTFTTSAWQDISAHSANLDGFMARGGKLIVPHGVSDPVFSINDTLAWLQEVTARYGQKTNSTVRVFPVPGMAHCFGGPSTNQYDAFTAITQWVEHNQAPDAIIATAGPDTPWPERSRPLCPHPQMAVYNGSGSIEDASNFTCK